MTDGEALLAAILANPDEDAARLVYADWLQENGQIDRAEFIRVQIELAGIPEPEELTIGVIGQITDEQNTKHTCPVCRKLNGPGLCRYHTLRYRERELIGPHKENEYSPNAWEWFAKNIPTGNGYITSRGFVDSISCTAGAWSNTADIILAQHPVRKVTVLTWPRFVFERETESMKARGRLENRSEWVPIGPEDSNSADAPQRIVTAIVKGTWPEIKINLPRVLAYRNIGTFETPIWIPDAWPADGLPAWPTDGTPFIPGSLANLDRYEQLGRQIAIDRERRLMEVFTRSNQRTIDALIQEEPTTTYQDIAIVPPDFGE